ncbi:MAG: prepilin-type N-terminal cleavage/methylation domain-containing protein [Planctomycetota bacterium]|jgi:hypothetical protein
MNRRNDPGRPARRAGFSLLELLLTLTITTIILGGMGSIVLLAGRTTRTAAGSSTPIMEAGHVLADLTADLRLAVTISERTATSIQFTVPDRDGDGGLESIRYAWSGAPGDPLTRQYNGGLPVVVTEDVHALDLTFLDEAAVGSGGTSRGSDAAALSVLLVVENADSPGPMDSLRRYLLESWGYNVTLIDDAADSVAFNAAVPLHDVVYVGGQVDPARLGTKLTWSPVGVVCEEQGSVVNLGIADQPRAETVHASIIVEGGGQYITSGFFPGLLPVQTLLKRSLEWAADAESDAPAAGAALFAQFDDPAQGNHNHTVKADDWAVASIVPQLPEGAESYTITRFRFITEQRGSPDKTLIIQIRGRALDGSPTTYVIAQTLVEESSLPESYDWFEVEFTEVGPIPAGEGVCITIAGNTGTDAARVMYEDDLGAATPRNQFWWKNPTGWDTDVKRDMPCELLGTIQMGGGS